MKFTLEANNSCSGIDIKCKEHAVMVLAKGAYMHEMVKISKRKCKLVD